MAIDRISLLTIYLGVSLTLGAGSAFAASGDMSFKRDKNGHPDLSGMWFLKGFERGDGRVERDPDLRLSLS